MNTFVTAVILFATAGTGYAQSSAEREPFGYYGGVGVSYFGDSPTATQMKDLGVASIYFGRNFRGGHLEAQADFAVFDQSADTDDAHRIQLSYSPEWIGETEIAFYVARSYFGDLLTDVTEYGVTSNTIISEKSELYLSGGVFDANGTTDFGVSAAIDYHATDALAAELAAAFYDGVTVGQATLSYAFGDTGLGANAAVLVDDAGETAVKIGLSYQFGVDKLKFRPTITPFEMGVLFGRPD